MKFLKKSVPVWAVFLSLLVVVSVAAAFLFTFYFQGDITAKDAPEIALLNSVCTITAGSGTVDSCAKVGNNLEYVVSGADDETVLEIEQNYQNQVTTKDWNYTPTSETAISAQSCVQDDLVSPCSGTLAIDEYFGVIITLEFGNLTPSENVVIADSFLSANDN